MGHPGKETWRRKKPEGLRLEALAKLSKVVTSPLVKEEYTLLAEAACSVATLQIRNRDAIGGSLAQNIRRWYPMNILSRIPMAKFPQRGESIHV